MSTRFVAPTYVLMPNPVYDRPEFLTAHVFLMAFSSLFPAILPSYIQHSTLCDIGKQRVDSVIHIVTTLTIF